MGPEALLAEYKRRTDAELEQYFRVKISDAATVSQSAEQITKDLAEFTLRGGKRFRAALIYYSYKLFGGTNEGAITKLSIFIELIQSFLLIHDDIMDRSPLRRGGPTMHTVYEQFSKDHDFNDDTHFGQAIGTLAGDIASQLAVEIISESDFPAEKKVELLSLVSKEVHRVCLGQLHDILLGYNYPPDFEEQDILAVYSYKTATYTFKLPLFAGAILAGATKNELKTLESYAMHCGIAYQTRDDVLGVFGNTSETGKDTISDLAEGKKTLLIVAAHRQANEEQKLRLKELIGKKDLNLEEAHEARSILEQAGARRYCENICEEKAEAAKGALTELGGGDPIALEFLHGIADYLVMRTT